MMGESMKPGEAGLSDLPVYLNGRAKLLVPAIWFLWTSLIGVGSWALGSRSAAMALDAHEDISGHPVMQQRVASLEALITVRLGSIDNRLLRIEQVVGGGP